jgi:5-methylcytosine-specific restriction enzyme B
MSHNYGEATEAKIAEVMSTCQKYGKRSIIALSGVPGTGKSFVAKIAAQRLATGPLMVREIQFHPTYSYEEFIEGYRADPAGGFAISNGAFLDWNYRARNDPDHSYVLLIEELTRANLPSVLGELMTYVEYRDREFYTLYGRTPVKIAEKLQIIATFNPRDRSALEMDDALIRRLRIIDCPPDVGQMNEMLATSKLSPTVKSKLGGIFDKCKQFCEAENRPDDYYRLMPFGHGIFADVTDEKPDLHLLWKQRLAHLLTPPGRQSHPFFDVIAKEYPWKNSPDATLAGGSS